MKKGIVFIIIVGLLIGIGITSFYLNSTNKINAEPATINSEKIKISPKVKFYVAIYGNYHKLYHKILAKGYDGREALNFISDGLGDKMYSEAQKLKSEPINATVSFTKNYDEPFVYTKDKIGKMVDLEKLYEDTARSIDDKSEVIYHIIEAKPQITYQELLDKTSLRGSFMTNFTLSSDSRKRNIQIASEYLNGHIIDSEGTMSFNEVVGARTEERGFEKANIIFNGQMVQGTGGGVCQVSSTMYNTSLLSGLNIIYSSRHSRVVPYLPASRDAMVSNSNDLVIGNPTLLPLYIVTKVDNNDLQIAIYGQKLNVEYKIRGNILTIIPVVKENKIIVEGDNIPDSIREALLSNNKELLKDISYEEIIKIEGRDGIISEAYLDIYYNGELRSSKLISHDKYYPQQGVIIRRVI